jgi:glutaconyl-CoA/methylmalonyl-CoA decarboxylase subunit delta
MSILNKLIFLTEEYASSAVSGNFNGITFDLSNIINGNGLIMSIVGYLIVLLSLFILWILISGMSKLLVSSQRKRLKEIGHRAADKDNLYIEGEISAAIAMTLYMHFQQLHDFENAVLTIKRIHKIYSPWSSKLYNLTETPAKY